MVISKKSDSTGVLKILLFAFNEIKLLRNFQNRFLLNAISKKPKEWKAVKLLIFRRQGGLILLMTSVIENPLLWRSLTFVKNKPQNEPVKKVRNRFTSSRLWIYSNRMVSKIKIALQMKIIQLTSGISIDLNIW